MGHQFFAATLASIGLCACTFTPQKADIKPEIQVSASNIGQGKTVGVLVTEDHNLSEVFRQAVFDGLKAKNFVPTDISSSVDRQLKVEIRTLNYSTSTGFWTGGMDTKAAIKVIVTASGMSYENMYRSANEERVVVVPTAEHNSEMLNNVVNDVLAKPFEDQALLSALSTN